MKYWAKLVAVFLVLVTVGCSGPNRQPNNSLYQQLGGAAGVEKITDNLLYHIGESTLLSEKFEDTNIQRFRTKLIEHLCVITDGPCEYTGDPMPEVHAGLGIGPEHFDALVIALVAALDESGVATATQNDLLQRLAAMYDEVMRDAQLTL